MPCSFELVVHAGLQIICLRLTFARHQAHWQVPMFWITPGHFIA